MESIPFSSDSSNPTDHSDAPQCQADKAAAAAADDAMELGPKQTEDQEDAATAVASAAAAVVKEEEAPAEPSPEVAAPGKRKRGRPRKSQTPKQPAAARKEKDEEEVCFICFDGGNLVCCDRRGCPKVYHAACIHRDEAFFQTRGKWNCGWHLCSNCQKAAQYLCYTCTYSLCKGCYKEKGFLCVRGNKGFCETCYDTVMLIESKGHANEKVEITFDDKNSFECLFKEYWFDMKRKLSLTAEELQNAKKSVRGSGSNVRKGDSSSDELYIGNDEEVSSDSSSGRRGAGNSVRKKARRRSRAIIADENHTIQVDNIGTSISEDAEWASKELLELVAHMKGGDKSVLSQFDVQALLLDYIKQNNLRDPRRKSQIICDAKLGNLFGKARVGHFEMLKLLESHFLIKEASQVVTDDNQEAVVDPDSGLMDADSYADTRGIYDKRRKSRKKVEEREPQTNFDDYAAIDVHNISLIFLRRNLVEDLLDDLDRFTEKVIGSFVRIRISSSGQKQDMYRLVQVVGTPKTAKIYKTGRKTTDFMLEIQNLNKKEVITIDTVSNQDFTEEECKRLRQSIKLGLIDRLTVGYIQERTRILQAARVNDWLESEKQRLGHLRDRASETGRRKELRECVEKLQLLNSPEERMRRLNEVPEIHSDPKMDPHHESADEEESDDKNLLIKDVFSRPRDSSLRMGKDLLSPGRGCIASGNWVGGRKGPSGAWDSSRSARADGARDKAEPLNIVTDRKIEPFWFQEKGVPQTHNWETGNGRSNANGLDATICNNKVHIKGPEQSHGVTPETTSPTPEGSEDTEKIWHYKDPAGKIQGPFSMVQLKKWNTTGYFPVEMRIWRTSENEDSVLLTDALIGKFDKDLPKWAPPQGNYSQPRTFAAGADIMANDQGGGWRENDHLTSVGNDPISGAWAGTNNVERSNAWASQLSTVSAPIMEVVNPREVRSGVSAQGWEPSRDTNAWPGQTQVQSIPGPTSPFHGNQRPPSYQGTGVHQLGSADGWNPGTDHRSNWNSNNQTLLQPAGHWYGHQPSNWGSAGQRSSTNQWGNASYTLPTPTPQPSSRVWNTAQGNINVAAPLNPVVQFVGTGWGSMNTPASPTPSVHPMGTGWGTMNVPAPATPFQPIGAGRGITSGAGLNGGLQSAPASMIQNRDAPAANPIGGIGGWGSNSASMPNIPNQITGTNAGQVPRNPIGGTGGWGSNSASAPSVANHNAAHAPRSQHIDALNGMENCSAVLPRNEVISPSNHAALGCSAPSEQNRALSKNEFFESGCPSPTPNERLELPAVQLNELEKQELPAVQLNELERPELPAVQLNELDTGKRWSEANKRLGSDPASVSHALGTSNPPSTLQSEVFKLRSSNLVEESDPQDMSPIRGTEAKPTPPALTTKPSVDSDNVEFLSTQRPEGWPSASRENQDPDGLIQSPAYKDPSLRKHEHVKTSNLDAPQDTMRGDMWSLPSPTPASKPSDWNVDAVSPSGNGQNVPGSSTEQSRASQSGWVTSDREKPSTGWGVAPQAANMGIGSAQGDLRTGWGTTAQGNIIIPRVLGNPNQGWGTWQEHMNATANQGAGAMEDGKISGWGSGTTEESSMAGWGSANQSSGWETEQNQSADRYRGGHGRDSGYDSRHGGYSRRGSDSMHDSRYRGESRRDSRYAGNSRHDSRYGGDSKHDSRYGDSRRDSRHGDLRYGGDSRHGGGRSHRSERMHRDCLGRSSSRTPPRGEGQGQGQGQGQGICKFHESGHCKKGASCNYVHS